MGTGAADSLRPAMPGPAGPATRACSQGLAGTCHNVKGATGRSGRALRRGTTERPSKALTAAPSTPGGAFSRELAPQAEAAARSEHALTTPGKHIPAPAPGPAPF